MYCQRSRPHICVVVLRPNALCVSKYFIDSFLFETMLKSQAKSRANRNIKMKSITN